MEAGYTTADGHLKPVRRRGRRPLDPSPEALAREADEVGRVIAHAGTGVQPLVVVVEPRRSCATTSWPRSSKRPA